MSHLTMTELMMKTAVSELNHYYKTFVIKNRTDCYYDVEKYFKKYGKEDDFKNSWAYKMWNTYFESEEYRNDIDYVMKEYKTDMFEGFDSAFEELINMEDDETEQEKLVEIRNEFKKLLTEEEKINYLSMLYKNNLYYPNFSHLWLYNCFEDRIF